MDRKRSYSEVNSGTSSEDRKKRTAPGGPDIKASRMKNARPSVEDEEDEDADSLTPIIETFRKEAIYRQMLEYKRAHNRSLARVGELEKRKHALEAGLEGVEVCWSVLLESIRGLIGSKDLPDVPPITSSHYPRDESDLPELSAAVDKRSQSTKDLLIKFVELAERGARASSDEIRQRSKADEKNSATLRSSIKLLQSQLDLAKEYQEKTLADLLKAEKKYDRLRCQSVNGQQPPQPEVNTTAVVPSTQSESNSDVHMNDSAAVASPGIVNGSDGKMEGTPVGSTASTPAHPALGGGSEAEDRFLAESRLKEVNRLRDDRRRLEIQVDILRSEAEHPSESVIAGSGLFKQLLVQVATFKTEAAEAKNLFEKLTTEADALRDNRKTFEDTALDASSAEVDLLRNQLGKRESDLARLRNQRDECQAELHEKKTLENTRFRYTEEVMNLVNTKQERILTLVSEVGRLKLKLAANAGSEEIFQFLLQHLEEESIEASYVKDLETKFLTTENKMNALSQQLVQIGSKPDLKTLLASESKARQDLAEAERRLEAFEKVLGPDPSVGKDIKLLTIRLEEKAKELKMFDLKAKENEAAMDALYSEVERLSKAWEEAEALAASKMLNLKDIEDRLFKVSTEKAKADNKYFAAMRAKEAVESEKKMTLRNLEKQAKVLEKLTESENGLSAMLASREKEATMLRTNVKAFQERVNKLQGEVAESKALLESEKGRSAELNKALTTRITIAEKERASHMSTGEELARLKREIERKEAALEKSEKALGKAKSVVSSGGLDSSLQEERNNLYSILRCSTCQLRMRSHCLTKCMHTFCKDCVDARIQTRQRKCPACNLPFAVSDVQQVYFQ
ncbi:E3 ubiquitin ligase involved in syntaxin degradation [Phaffia rhodozyma]|uniref:E3 ubiquitin protein ligase n=1 Tax=Phaffia rhodozyma TaxID=264483 RepID=A0A0F7SIT1_PHARH|nr:E3 ubiquitin ligase involved in syntaxin degradation [Phaffia rhodozyma]